MIDLHTHTFFSDGTLTPSELVYRAKLAGYSAIALTDHGDFTNFDLVIPRMKKASSDLSKYYNIQVIAGIEITYVPPEKIKNAVALCRKLGAKIVVIHGQTPAETVPEGTNLSGIIAKADIIAHPGYISEEEALLATRFGVCLEITTRKGHNATNAHVAKTAIKAGAKLILNTDTHHFTDLLTKETIINTLNASGLNQNAYKEMQENAKSLIGDKK